MAALIAFTLPRTMPTDPTYEGEICPDLDSGQGHVMVAIAVASIATGAVAIAASFIAIRRRAARPRRLLAGAAAALLTPAILVAAGRRWVVRLLRLTSVRRGVRHQPRSHAFGVAHTPTTGT